MREVFSPQAGELTLIVAIALAVAVSAVAAGQFDLPHAAGQFILPHAANAIPLWDGDYVAEQGPPSRDEQGGGRMEGDWTWTSRGATLHPGQSGQIILRVQNDPGARLIALLHGQGGAGFHVGVSVSGDGRRYREVARGALEERLRIDLTPALGEWNQVWIRLSAAVEPGAGRNVQAALSHVRIMRDRVKQAVHPTVPLAAMLILTPLLAYVAFSAKRPQWAVLSSLGVLGALAVLSEIVTQADPGYRCGITRYLWWLDPIVQDPSCSAYLVLPYALLLGFFAWHVWVRRPSLVLQEEWARFALIGIVVWGAALRFEELSSWYWVALDPDAMYYQNVARTMSSPYDTGSREPLWMWVYKAWSMLAGDTEPSFRLLTVSLSLLVIYASYRLFRDYTRQPFVGLLVALLLSLNPYLVRLSVRGLREEAYMLLILCFIYLVFVRTRERSLPAEAIGLALSGAAIVLLRLNSYVFVVPLLLFWAWKRSAEHGRRSWMALALIGGFLAVAVAPHLVHNEGLSGDPLFSLNNLATGTRNKEFIIVKGTGCPGCPTAEQVRQNLFAGPSVTTFEYLFGMHSLRELTGGLAEGYWNMYLWPSDLYRVLAGQQFLLLTYGFYLLGLVLLLWSRYREMLLVVLLLSNIVPFFLAMKILDVRLVMHVAPFVAFIVAYGVWKTMEVVGRSMHALGATGALNYRVAGMLR
jgi:hypothetical protein